MTFVQVARTEGRLGSQVYDLVKQRLLVGRYAAGERISLEELKQIYGVSKQPLMDAMRRLATDGLVEIIPQVGCRVPRFAAEEVGDFYTIFAGMEGAVAGIAAQRRSVGQLVELRELNSRIISLAAVADAADRSKGYRLLNRDFHACVHQMAASRIIAETSHRMWDLSDLLINTAGVPQPLASAIPERAHDHDEIIDALDGRDPLGARAAMESHILSTVGIIQAERAHHGSPQL